MKKEVWGRNELESPCVKTCVINSDNKACIGCFRTISEISNWSKFTNQTRKEIMADLKGRAKEFAPKRQGGRKRGI